MIFVDYRNFVRSAVIDLSGNTGSVVYENMLQSQSPAVGAPALPQGGAQSLFVPSAGATYVIGPDINSPALNMQAWDVRGNLIFEQKISGGFVSPPSVMGIYQSPTTPTEVSVMALIQSQDRGTPDLIQFIINGTQITQGFLIPTVVNTLGEDWFLGSTNPYHRSPGLMYLLDLVQPDESYVDALVVQDMSTGDYTPLTTPIQNIDASSLTQMGASGYILGAMEYQDKTNPASCTPTLSFIDGSQQLPAINKVELPTTEVINLDPVSPSGEPQQVFRAEDGSPIMTTSDPKSGLTAMVANVQTDTQYLGNKRYSTVLWTYQESPRDDSTINLYPPEPVIPTVTKELETTSSYGVVSEGFWTLTPVRDNTGVLFVPESLDSAHAQVGSSPLSDGSDSTYFQVSGPSSNEFVGKRVSAFVPAARQNIERMNISAQISLSIPEGESITLGFAMGSASDNYASATPNEIFGQQVQKFTSSTEGKVTVYSADVPMQSIFTPHSLLSGPMSTGALLGGVYVVSATSRDIVLDIFDVKINAYLRQHSPTD